jgi:hypothetical protein
MGSPSTTDGSGPEYRTIPVTDDLREQLRVAKAKRGVSYDEYLRAELSLED